MAMGIEDTCFGGSGTRTLASRAIRADASVLGPQRILGRNPNRCWLTLINWGTTYVLVGLDTYNVTADFGGNAGITLAPSPGVGVPGGFVTFDMHAPWLGEVWLYSTGSCIVTGQEVSMVMGNPPSEGPPLPGMGG